MNRLFRGDAFLKILALLTALVTYFFIHNEMYRMNKPPEPYDQSFKLLKPTAKKIPLKVRLATEPPEGYKIDEDLVTANPSSIIVIGPEALLDDASSAETALVDVSENTKTVVKKIPVESVAGTHLSGEPYMVEVTVPIRKSASAEAVPAPAPAS